jgi:hypothetical protein
MELLPIIAITAIGAISFCLILAAFALAALRGEWRQATQADADGNWSVVRYLMLAGAFLGALFGFLLFLPGVIPWWDYSSPFTSWGLGVAFGFGLATLYWQFAKSGRNHALGTNGKPSL